MMLRIGENGIRTYDALSKRKYRADKNKKKTRKSDTSIERSSTEPQPEEKHPEGTFDQVA